MSDLEIQATLGDDRSSLHLFHPTAPTEEFFKGSVGCSWRSTLSLQTCIAPPLMAYPVFLYKSVDSTGAYLKMACT